jgi:hypothetical protein
MNHKQRLERYKGDFETLLNFIIELQDNPKISLFVLARLATMKSICKSRIKEIENLTKHNIRKIQSNNRKRSKMELKEFLFKFGLWLFAVLLGFLFGYNACPICMRCK